jgi:hypothetical protein
VARVYDRRTDGHSSPVSKVEKPYDEAAEAKRHIGFAIPEDSALLAAFGELAISHTQLDYVWRMMIKNLDGLAFQKAREETARVSSFRLREWVLKSAGNAALPAEDLATLQKFVNRAEALAERRNGMIHGLVGKELDGEYVIASDIGMFDVLPTAAQVTYWARCLQQLRDEANRFSAEVIWPHVGRRF